MGKISKPEFINETHQLDDFDSHEGALDHWLKARALEHDAEGATRTCVVHDNMRVVAYYTLVTGSVVTSDAPGRMRRNISNPMPVMVLGRLAVDKAWQQRGIGRGLLKDAVLRTLRVSQETGIQALLVHVLSESAKYFYKRYGFMESPIAPMTLMLPMKDFKPLIAATI